MQKFDGRKTFVKHFLKLISLHSTLFKSHAKTV